MNPLKTLRSVVRFERIETDPVERRLARAASVADLRRIAKRRLPGGVFDYIDGGAEDERTMEANTAAFAAVCFSATHLARRVWHRPDFDDPRKAAGVSTRARAHRVHADGGPAG